MSTFSSLRFRLTGLPDGGALPALHAVVFTAMPSSHYDSTIFGVYGQLLLLCRPVLLAVGVMNMAGGVMNMFLQAALARSKTAFTTGIQ